jgi:hypothetical protein
MHSLYCTRPADLFVLLKYVGGGSLKDSDVVVPEKGRLKG